MLERKTTVLTRHPVQRHAEFVYFQYGGDNDEYRVGYYLPRVDYDFLDQPDDLTVSIDPVPRIENGLKDYGLHISRNLVTAEDLAKLPAGSVVAGPSYHDELYKHMGADLWLGIGSDDPWNSHQLEPRGPFFLLKLGSDD
jgi:hypothetical protein